MAVKRVRKRQYFPEIEFESTKVTIKPKEKVRLTWRTSEEEEIKFWSDTTDPCSEGPFDWGSIHERGEEVPQSGEITLSPEETTTYFLTITNGAGFAGKKVTVHVGKRAAKVHQKPFECTISPESARKMVKSHVIRCAPNIEKSYELYDIIKKLIESGGF